MQAAAFTKYGGIDTLELCEVETPQPSPDQVLIRVHCSSVNPLDWKLRSGMLRFVFPVKRPFVTGFDVAGVIDAVGSEVTQWKPGDRVVAGLTAGGGHAEYVAVDQDLIVAAPSNASFRHCAAIPAAGVSALQALRDLGGADAGKRVLINGATGGVGSFAIQVGRALRCHVTAVCSAGNVTLARQLGADDVMDYAQESPLDREGFDIFFDVVPNCSFRSCLPALNSDGTYITTLPGPGVLAWKAVALTGRVIGFRKRCAMLIVRPNEEDLRYLCELTERGELKSVVENIYPLQQIREANEQCETGHTRGKIVIDIQHDEPAS